MKLLAVLLFPLMSIASDYRAQQITEDGTEVVLLADSARHAEVFIVPSIGNMAYKFLVNGKNVFWMPYETLREFKAKPQFGGVPFLAPWANRLSGYAYWANGKKYQLNRELGNVQGDQNKNPIHGLLNYSPDWKVVAVSADGDGASVTSRLEFWKQPDLMAQFPFAHTIEMTYRLHEGGLEVRTRIENLSTDPMPVAVGFHPYFQLHEAPRDQWKVHLAAHDHYVLSKMVIPTGEKKPIEFGDPLKLEGVFLDDVFGGLDPDATFWVEGAHEKIAVTYGPKYKVAVVYAPRGRSFICFEPMSALTDGFNLAHAGLYPDLQSIAPGGEWSESFWIKPSGF